MDFIMIDSENIQNLKELHSAYKASIGEEIPTDAQFECLCNAIENKDIYFFGCLCDNVLVACCSIPYIYSTFNYARSGIFEDFYILPEYRHQGIAKKLVQFSVEKSKVESLMVGCADCDVEMYKSVGFRIELGNMLAFDS